MHLQKSLIMVCAFSLCLSAHEKLEIKKNLTTSIIIPCHYKHASHLYALIRCYEEQTIMPDEIIISLSGCKKIEPAIIQNLLEYPWQLNVQVILSESQKYAGENRNIACSAAKGDIFILQDADDIPHSQRVEIIKYFFEHYDIDHLVHNYCVMEKITSHNNFIFYKNLDAIPFTWPTLQELAGKRYTNGNIAIARDVFRAIKWSRNPRGQDTEFNQAIYKSNFNNRLLLPVPLIAYRQFLSITLQKTDNSTTTENANNV